MDLQMPRMGGLEAAEVIRAREKGTERYTPIVALTACAMVGDEEKALDVGMDGYVTKPIKREALSRAIAETAPKKR